jgi:hypothetical protein
LPAIARLRTPCGAPCISIMDGRYIFSRRPDRSDDFDGDLARHRLTVHVCSRDAHPPQNALVEGSLMKLSPCNTLRIVIVGVGVAGMLLATRLGPRLALQLIRHLPAWLQEGRPLPSFRFPTSARW